MSTPRPPTKPVLIPVLLLIFLSQVLSQLSGDNWADIRDNYAEITERFEL